MWQKNPVLQINFFLVLKSVEGMNEQIQEVFHVPDLRGDEPGDIKLGGQSGPGTG